jgi:hypothetical protein
MTVRGGGFPTSPLAFMPIGRMGPPLRSFAADAHDCIVVRVLGPTGYKVVARLHRARKRAPLNRHPDRTKRAIVLKAVKVWPDKRRANEAGSGRKNGLSDRQKMTMKKRCATMLELLD